MNNEQFQDSNSVSDLAYKEISTANIRKVLADSTDVVIQSYYLSGCRNTSVTAVFIDGLVDIKIINDNILKPLLQERLLEDSKDVREVMDLIMHGALYHASRRLHVSLPELINDVLNGSVAFIFDSENQAISFDTKGFEKRTITEPTTENTLKGSKDSFIEVLRVNTALVRRKIRTPNLRIKEITIGKQTKTPIDIIYIEGLTNQLILDELISRLKKIDIDGVITAGNIEEYIIDNKYTLFPQVLTTERSDKFCANVLEGRVGMLIDGMPVAYIIPGTLNMFYQAPEDYAQNFIVSSFIRLLRHIGSIITLLLPGFYVSITSFHQEMIPTLLAISIIKSKAEVPFPTLTSVFLILIAFEVLLEAGLRLPKAIGQAMSIIGTLVVGQAAIQAKLISPAVVIVVATTGIFGFAMPNQDYSNALRIIRMIFTIAAGIAGLYGMSLIMILTVYHLNTMESFNVPYFSPYAANENKQIVFDTIIRVPLIRMKKRPSSLKTTNKVRRQ